MNKLVVPIPFFWTTVLAIVVRCGALEQLRIIEYQIIVMGVQGFALLPHILLACRKQGNWY